VTGAFNDCMLNQDELSKAFEREERKERKQSKRFNILKEAHKHFMNDKSDTESM